MSALIELNNDEIDVLIKDAIQDIKRAGDRLRDSDIMVELKREASIITARIERIEELEALKEENADTI